MSVEVSWLTSPVGWKVWKKKVRKWRRKVNYSWWQSPAIAVGIWWKWRQHNKKIINDVFIDLFSSFTDETLAMIMSVLYRGSVPSSQTLLIGRLPLLAIHGNVCLDSILRFDSSDFFFSLYSLCRKCYIVVPCAEFTGANLIWLYVFWVNNQLLNTMFTMFDSINLTVTL